MGLQNQDTQLRSSRTYNDTIALGALIPSAAADKHIEYDLNAIRSQLARLLGGSWTDPPIPDQAFVVAMIGV